MHGRNAHPAHKASGHASQTEHSGHDGRAAYVRLLLMVLLSFSVMYALMYAMVDRFDNVFHNINQVYMAALMAAPMLLIEIALMWKMYPDRHLNVGLIAAAIVVLCVCWFGIRAQALVGEQQFLRSMIPHHAGAILMCEQNSFSDPDLQALCREIITSQTEEIARMRAMLR